MHGSLRYFLTIRHHYCPRAQAVKGFTHVCLSFCLLSGLDVARALHGVHSDSDHGSVVQKC